MIWAPPDFGKPYPTWGRPRPAPQRLQHPQRLQVDLDQFQDHDLLVNLFALVGSFSSQVDNPHLAKAGRRQQNLQSFSFEMMKT
jgi:hypothetical protein